MKRWLVLIPLCLSGCSQEAPPAPADSPAPAATTPAAANPAEAGKKLFEASCSACHGPEGGGIPSLGKALKGSPMLKLSDADLVAFINKGRDANDPANTTKVAMPPKGGNPGLTDDDLGNIVTYIRSLK